MAQSIRRKGTVSPADLAKRWRIGLETARRTIDHTTPLGVHDFFPYNSRALLT
jgi:hypothetical protein